MSSHQPDRSHLPYRTNVGAILRRHDDLILMCERIRPVGTWQFPQGGVDPPETHEEALWRELTEELGLQTPMESCRLVSQGPPTNYEFAPDYDAPIARKYRGQTQTLFLLDYVGSDDDFDLEFFHEPEFRDFQWVTRDIAREMIWSFKSVVLEATLESLAAEFRDGFLGRK